MPIVINTTKGYFVEGSNYATWNKDMLLSTIYDVLNPKTRPTRPITHTRRIPSRCAMPIVRMAMSMHAPLSIYMVIYAVLKILFLFSSTAYNYLLPILFSSIFSLYFSFFLSSARELDMDPAAARADCVFPPHRVTVGVLCGHLGRVSSVHLQHQG